MKTISIISILIITTSTIFSQPLLLEENFSFSGNLTDNGWTAHSYGGTNPINTTTGLSYSGYQSSGIGNAALLDNSGEDVNKSFSAVSSGSIYISFLVNVTSIHSTQTEGYILHLLSGNSHFARFFVDYESSSSNVAFGIGQTTSTAAMKTSFSYSRGTTYLIVMKFSFISGLLNDTFQIWVINSGVPDSEINAGSPTLGPTSTTLEGGSNSDPSSIGKIALRQYNVNQNVIVDGIRISDSWSFAPLPVELTSFSASIVSNGVQLNWQTETEVNNYGFEIERASTEKLLNIPAIEAWNRIGFIPGHGNSNSIKEYQYVDNTALTGKFSYRLKQIDNSGFYNFSNVTTIDVDAPINYELYQNYPNPFNPSTTIRYSLSNEGHVRLSVFNILGEKVKMLVNETKTAGIHIINVDAESLKSGVYLYRLEVNGFSRVMKMNLLK